MSRRFVPPAVAAFGDCPGGDLARAIARARDEGFAAGRTLGLGEGHALGARDGEDRAASAHRVELDAMRLELAKHGASQPVTAALDRVLAARSADLAALERATRTALVSALRTLFPALLARSIGADVAALLTEALTARAPETLTLRAATATLQAVLDEGLPGPLAERLTLLPDPTLGSGAAEIGWSGGGLSFDAAALHERVLALLSPATSNAKEVAP